MILKCFGITYLEMLQILDICISEIVRERMHKVDFLKKMGSLPDGLLRTGVPWLSGCVLCCVGCAPGLPTFPCLVTGKAFVS